MAHLSSVAHPWGKPFTNKRYLHPPFAENIVTMWPTSMVMIGEILADDPQHYETVEGFGEGFVGGVASAGVIFTVKRESDTIFRLRNLKRFPMYDKYRQEHELMPLECTEYKTRKDGIPIHSLVKDLDNVKFYQEAFCDNKRVSTVYIKVTIENGFGIPQTIHLGTLVRTGPEFMLTGCFEPDGYGRCCATAEAGYSGQPQCSECGRSGSGGTFCAGIWCGNCCEVGRIPCHFRFL